jgi:hypothetical protein
MNDVHYKLFDHAVCGISTSIGCTSFTVLNNNMKNTLNMFPKTSDSVGSPRLEMGAMLRVGKSLRKDRQEQGRWKAGCSEKDIMWNVTNKKRCILVICRKRIG